VMRGSFSSNSFCLSSFWETRLCNNAMVQYFILVKETFTV
jgi:hypothetical protein